MNDSHKYDYHTRIINRTSATYENKLKILEKSSIASGTYTCTVKNSLGSMQRRLHIGGNHDLMSESLARLYFFSFSVCRDVELRFNNHSRNVEVCINDHWHALVNSAVVSNITLGNISSTTNSTSVTIMFTPPADLSVNRYDVSCTVSKDGLINSIKVTIVSQGIVTVNGLTSDTEYECCITAYILATIQLDTLSLSCIQVRTRLSQPLAITEMCSNLGITAFWSTLSVCLVLLICIGCIALLLCKQKCTAVKDSRV